MAEQGAIRALKQELKNLQKEPVEGFRVNPINENLHNWEVAIFGPPKTLYEGGYFKVATRNFFLLALWFAADALRFVEHFVLDMYVTSLRIFAKFWFLVRTEFYILVRT